MVCGAADPQLPPGLADGQDTGQDPAAGCPARGGQLLLDLASLRAFPARPLCHLPVSTRPGSPWC